MSYQPTPIDVAGVVLSAELVELTERLAESAHEGWALTRMDQGWTLGPNRDDEKKQHPGLVPYNELSESEKDLDRVTVVGTLKAILALGYKIVPPEA